MGPCMTKNEPGSVNQLVKAPVTLNPTNIQSTKLYVVTTYFNPANFAIKKKICENFKKHMASFPMVELYIIECAFDNRPFEVTTADNPKHIQVRTMTPIWLKESLLNLAWKNLPPQAEYVAWLDCDISFLNPN